MTQAPLGPQIQLPSAGLHLAKIARRESQPAAVKTQQDSIDEYWKDYWARNDELCERLVPTPPPQQRLRIYQNKPISVTLGPDGAWYDENGVALTQPPAPGVDDKGMAVPGQPEKSPANWHEQRARFPKDFAARMADWVQLEPVSVRRDQVLRELAALDIQEQMAQASAAMGAPPPLAPEPGPFGDVGAPPPARYPG